MFRAISSIFYSSSGSEEYASKSSAKFVPEESTLAKLTHSLVPDLLEAKSAKARTSTLSLLAKKLLFIGAKWSSVDWRQFALMHNASIIRKTSFEGGDIHKSISAWQNFLKMWQSGEGRFFDVGLSTKQIDAVLGALDDLAYFRLILPHLSLEPLKDFEVLHYAKSFQKALLVQLRAKKTVYIPLGYRHGLTNEGHAIPCKIVWEKDGVTIHPLNLGDGSEDHALLNFTTSQDKVSYRFYPIKVSHEDFWGENGLTAFCHIVRYEADPPQPEHVHYSGKDIYDIFQTLGRIIPDLGSHPEELEAKGQRSGTCPEKGVKNVAHDVLIDLKIEHKQIKKVFLNLYLCSLVTGYHDYLKNPDPLHRHLLRNAAEEFGITLEKLRKEMSHEEYLGGIAIVQEIKKITKDVPEVSSKAEMAEEEMEEPASKEIDIRGSTLPQEFPKVEEERVASTKSFVPSLEEKKMVNVKPYVPSFEIKKIHETLDLWIKTVENLPSDQAFEFLCDCTRTLPIPEWRKEDEWDTLPLEETKVILKKFETLLFLGLKGNRVADTIYANSTKFFDQVLAIHTLYVIADKLARKCKWTKLDGFASPFIPHIHKIEPSNFTSIPLGADNHRYARISHYFEKSRKEAKKKVIFPIEPVLSVEQYEKEALSSHTLSQGVNHILFLRQHVCDLYPKASVSQLGPIYLYVWENMKETLPPEVCSLYYFSFLSTVAFFGDRGHGSSFPQELIFEKGFDDSGKKGLLVKAKDKKLLKHHPSSKENKRSEQRLEDKRFKGMGINENFLLIFDRYYLQFNTNDSVCARIDEKEASLYKISEPIYRDMLRITRNENLKVPLALHWASTHLVYLEHKGIQMVLDHCFFSSTGLYDRLKEEPLLIHSLRKFISEGLVYFRDNPHHIDSILFLIRTGICFETHYRELYGSEKSNEALLFYKGKLENLLKLDVSGEKKTEITHHIIFADVHRGNRELEETVVLLKTMFRLSFMKSSNELKYKWLKDRIPYFRKELAFQLEKEFLDPTFRHEVCHAFFKHCLPDMFMHVKNGEWEGDFPTFRCGEFTIDLFKGEIAHHEKGRLEETDFTGRMEGWKSLEKEHGARFWFHEGKYESLDGKLRIGHDERGLTYEKEILYKGERRWARVYQFDCETIDKENLDFLNHGTYLPYAHYIFLDKKSSDPDVVTYSYETNQPVFQIDYKSSGCEITRLDAFGNPTSVKMVNLSLIKDKEHPLYRCALRFALPSRVLCFVNTRTMQVEELNFFYIRLQFKRTEHGLESIQHPGYYLQLNETLEELNHFPAVFILKSLVGERKVLLPTPYLKASAEDFSTEVEISKSYMTHDEKQYFVFDIDSIDQSLKSQKFTANIYLALLLKMQRDEVRALKYLNRVKPSHFFDFDTTYLLDKFTTLHDLSPASLAFNVKLLYFVCDNMNFMLEDRFGDKRYQCYYDKLISWGQKAYIDYLKAMSQEELSAIPKDLRLTLEEERAILRALKNKFDEGEKNREEKREFPQLLALRYKLLCGGKEKVTAKIAPKTLKIRPPSYANLKSTKKFHWLIINDVESEFPYGENRKKRAYKWENTECLSFPNRATPEAIEAHFPELYERARTAKLKGTDPIDFTLLACLKVKSRNGFSDGEKLAHLLFYVRHFSHLFLDLSFEGVKTDKKKNEIFNEIVTRVMNLEETKALTHFKEEFLEESVLFDFSRETELRLPTPKGYSPAVLEKKSVAWDSQPFLSYRRALFKRKTIKPSYPEAPPFLDKGLAFEPETLEADIVGKFTKGYEELKVRKRSTYEFKPHNMEKVKKSLASEKERFHQELVGRRKKLIKQVNTPYKVHEGKLTATPLMEEMEFRLQRDTLQTLTILPETIMKEVVLRNNPAFLRQHCPLLKPYEIEEIIHEVCDYYHYLVLYQVAKEAEEIVQKLEKKPENPGLQADLCTLLNYEFLYDPREYPEISYFKVTNGKLPRPVQAQIYKWVCEGLDKGENRLFQHKAGGGKTDYLTPLLMLRAKRLGFTPIFLSTPLIYSVDRENLSYTMKTLDDKLGYLEVGLHTKLGEPELKFIYEQLTQYHEQGRGLIFTPQTFYSLRLQYFHAGIKEKDTEKVRWLGKILNHFETKCLVLGDEAHRNYDPLTRAIYGTGDFFLLPKEENALFLDLLKPLLGFEEVLCDNELSVSEVSRMAKNVVGTPSKKDISLIQEALAKYMSQSKKLDIPEKERLEVVNYWVNKEAPQPEYLLELSKADRQKADLIALTGYFILDLVPQLVNMRTELDHAPSIYPEEEFDTPCHHKTPSTAQYEDSYLSCSASIKGTAHRALSEMQIHKMIEKLLEKDWKEQSETHSKDTKSSKLFESWVDRTSFEETHLRDISLSHPRQMAALAEVLAKHPVVIDYYLSEFILPQIGYCLQQLSSTPAHLLNGFARSVLFSATPLSPLMYPRSIGEVRYDPEFEAEVAVEFCHEKNQNKVIIESPESFFSEMKEEERSALFNETTAFIDPAGFFCDSKNEEVAKNWLENSAHLDGVLYFKEGRSLKVDKGEKICLILRSNPKVVIELEGSNIKEALAACSLDWEKLKLGTYYDASHCESANILQKIGTNALVFMVDNLTTSRLVQALMRLRGLLEADMIQHVAWVYPKGLLKKIPPSSTGELDGSAIFAWTVSNEVEQMKKRVVLAAFQEISYQIEQKATSELKKHLDDPEEQIALMEAYEKGLLEETVHDPYGTFAEHERDEKARTVLLNFTKRQYSKFGYKKSLEENTVLAKQIETIIQDTEERIQNIATNWGRKLSMEVEQHTRLKKETEQENYRPRPFDPISAEGAYGKLKITVPDYPSKLWIKSAQNIFKTDKLTERLYLEINQLRTAKDSGERLEEKFLKPIDFFMILIPEKGKPMAVADSNDFLSGDLKRLAKGTDNPEVKHKAFLVTSEGKLLQRGKGRLAPSEEEMKEILESDWMRNLVIDAALLRGQIAHPEELGERIKNWKGFTDFWYTLVRSQPNPEISNRNGMLKLLAKTL